VAFAVSDKIKIIELGWSFSSGGRWASCIR